MTTAAFTQAVTMAVEEHQKSLLGEEPNIKHVEYVMADPSSTKWLIAYLARRNIPFAVIPLGAGVRRVTTRTRICKCCNGTGRSMK